MEKAQKVLTVAQACAKLNVSRATLYKMKKDGKLSGFNYNDNGRRYFTESELDEFIQSNRNE